MPRAYSKCRPDADIEAVREYITQGGLSDRDIAYLTRVPRTTVQRWRRLIPATAGDREPAAPLPAAEISAPPSPPDSDAPSPASVPRT